MQYTGLKKHQVGILMNRLKLLDSVYITHNVERELSEQFGVKVFCHFVLNATIEDLLVINTEWKYVSGHLMKLLDHKAETQTLVSRNEYDTIVSLF